MVGGTIVLSIVFSESCTYLAYWPCLPSGSGTRNGGDVSDLIAEVEDAVGAARVRPAHLVAHGPRIATLVGAGQVVVDGHKHLADVAVAQVYTLGAEPHVEAGVSGNICSYKGSFTSFIKWKSVRVA